MPIITIMTIKTTEPVRGTSAPIHTKVVAVLVMGRQIVRFMVRRQMVVAVAQTIVMNLTSMPKTAAVVAGMIMAT
jgi:hypothetical protein